MSTVVKDLGAVSAYAYAVEKGYTGTEAEFAELMASYADVGQTAVDAKDAAVAAKTAAETAANTATTKATEASQSASAAHTDAESADQSASQASTSAQTASTKASEASQSATTATEKATEATTAASNATTAKDDAVTAKNAAETAHGKAETAQGKAEQAAQSVSASAAQIQTNKEDISELKRELSYIGDTTLLNGWPAGDITEGAFYSTDGNYVENANWSCVSDYVRVKNSTQYTAKTFTSDGRIISPTYVVCWYDANKTFIWSNINTDNVTSPSNAIYARLSVMNNYKQGFMFAENYNGTYSEYGYKTSIKPNVYIPQNEYSALYGKTLCTVGDSITQGADMDSEGIVPIPEITMYQYNNSTAEWDEVTSNALATYGYEIAKRHKMEFYNGGVSGSVVAGLASRDGFALANGRYTKLPSKIDYLTIWFGWNDYAAITGNEGETLGALYSTDITTFYGAWNTVLDYLTENYPNTKICLCVPFGANGDIRDAVRAVADYWGVACWDNLQPGTPLYFNKEYGVSVSDTAIARNRAKYQAKGAHPNHKGHKQIADMLGEFIKGI